MIIIVISEGYMDNIIPGRLLLNNRTIYQLHEQIDKGLHMVNKYKTGRRNYPLLIGCGKFDIPMELEAVKAVNPIVP